MSTITRAPPSFVNTRSINQMQPMQDRALHGQRQLGQRAALSALALFSQRLQPGVILLAQSLRRHGGQRLCVLQIIEVLEALLVQHLEDIGAARTAKAVGARGGHRRAAVLAGRVRVHGGTMASSQVSARRWLRCVVSALSGKNWRRVVNCSGYGTGRPWSPPLDQGSCFPI